MTTESIISSTLCTVSALIFIKFSILILFGGRLGKVGRRFQFEMDEVMGGLMGIPRFSHLEGVVLGFGAIGALMSWSADPAMQLLTVMGLSLIVVYMVVCTVYAVYAKQPYVPYVLFCLLLIGLTTWRATRMLPPENLETVLVFGGIASVLCVLATLQMRRRRAGQAESIAKLSAILAFIEANEDWQWEPGQSAPVGFEAHQSETTKH